MRNFSKFLLLTVVGGFVLGSRVLAGPVLPKSLPDGISIISGVDPALPDADLAAIARVIGSANFVGLGESDHGSGGFIAAKFRMIKYLVKNAGFRAVVWEANRLDTQLATKFVQNGDGTPEAAVRALFSIWHDSNMIELLKWLRDFNIAHPSDQVTFVGMDIQEPYQNGPAITDFLYTVIPKQADRFLAGVKICFGATQTKAQFEKSVTELLSGAIQITADDSKTCLDSLAVLSNLIHQNRAAFSQATSAEYVVGAEIATSAFMASEGMLFNLTSHFGLGNEFRDQGMFDSFHFMRSVYFPNSRAIICAHNAHIAGAFDKSNGVYNGVSLFGSKMRRTYGGGYAAIGVIGYNVESKWSPGAHPPVPTDEDSIEQMLHQLGQQFLFVDTKSPFFTPGQFYKTSLNTFTVTLDPKANFDGLFYMDDSEAGSPSP